MRAGLDGTVEVTLPKVEGLEQTITVTAPAFQAPEEVKNSGFLMQPREILKSAAALQDVSRYVQGLLGVVIGSNDFRNDIIVRGGSRLENLFIVDNVEIPNINAFAEHLPRRAERDQPEELRQLQLEPPHQRAAVR